jgi:hypothetical protein
VRVHFRYYFIFIDNYSTSFFFYSFVSEDRRIGLGGIRDDHTQRVVEEFFWFQGAQITLNSPTSPLSRCCHFFQFQCWLGHNSSGSVNRLHISYLSLLFSHFIAHGNTQSLASDTCSQGLNTIFFLVSFIIIITEKLPPKKKKSKSQGSRIHEG